MKRESSMATTISHPIPNAQAQAIADLTGYEDAATVGKRKARYQANSTEVRNFYRVNSYPAR